MLRELSFFWNYVYLTWATIVVGVPTKRQKKMAENVWPTHNQLIASEITYLAKYLFFGFDELRSYVKNQNQAQMYRRQNISVSPTNSKCALFATYQSLENLMRFTYQIFIFKFCIFST